MKDVVNAVPAYISLHEWYAGLAMASIITSRDWPAPGNTFADTAKAVATMSCELADALIHAQIMRKR